MPAIPDTALPVGYYNNIQTWVIGKHEWKLDTTSSPYTRPHKSASVSYNYMADDSYVGDSCISYMLTQTDPNAVTETVVCWGSFKMSAGNVFTALTGRTRTFSPGKTDDGTVLKTKIIEIGAWNMNISPWYKNVTHGLTEDKIRSITVLITRDTIYGDRHDFSSRGGTIHLTSTIVSLFSGEGSYFDTFYFESTTAPANRGYIVIQYVD
jgi:hypothetical protein